MYSALVHKQLVEYLSVEFMRTCPDEQPMSARDRQIGAGTGHRHGHSEKRRGYQYTPILQRRKHRKTRLDVKIRDLLLQKLPILKKPLRISSKIVCQRVHNNVFCSCAQTTC